MGDSWQWQALFILTQKKTPRPKGVCAKKKRGYFWDVFGWKRPLQPRCDWHVWEKGSWLRPWAIGRCGHKDDLVRPLLQPQMVRMPSKCQEIRNLRPFSTTWCGLCLDRWTAPRWCSARSLVGSLYIYAHEKVALWTHATTATRRMDANSFKLSLTKSSSCACCILVFLGGLFVGNSLSSFVQQVMRFAFLQPFTGPSFLDYFIFCRKGGGSLNTRKWMSECQGKNQKLTAKVEGSQQNIQPRPSKGCRMVGKVKGVNSLSL